MKKPEEQAPGREAILERDLRLAAVKLGMDEQETEEFVQAQMSNTMGAINRRVGPGRRRYAPDEE